MKTTTLVLTPETLAAFINLIDVCLKATGLQMVEPAALVKPLLGQAQTALNKSEKETNG